MPISFVMPISFDIPVSFGMLSPFVGLKLDLSFPVGQLRGDRNLIELIRIFVTQERIELNPRHVRFGDVRHMTPGTFGDGRLRGRVGIRQWMMTISKEAPAIGLRESLAIFDSQVDAVV